jgi:tetratricopeptide (TPR) repeat protein
VLAAPASQWYRLRKFVRRQRGPVVAAGLVLLTLVGGIAGTTWGMLRAEQQRQLAEARKQEAADERDAKDVALKAEQQARADETKARQQAFAALRSMTDDVVERKFAQAAVLTEDDRAFLRGVIAQFDAFAVIKGDDADSRAVRAEGRSRVGLMRYRLGELQEAEQDYDQALSLRKQLAADFPSRPEFRRMLASSHNSRGLLLSDTGRLKEAARDYDQALRIRKQLAADFSNRPEFRQELAISHNNRGLLLVNSGRPKEAEQDYDQALRIQKQLAADFPSRPEFREDLAHSHNNRGILLRYTGRPKEAEQEYDQALRIQKQLAADFPNRPDLHCDVAGSCVNLAFLHLQQGNWAAAQRVLLEGRPHHLAALKANPRHPTYRQFYRNHLNVLTRVHAGLLEQKDAVRTAQTYRDLGWDAPVDAYDAACLLSLCIAIAAKHDKLDDQQRKEAAQFYGDVAMTLLRDAVSKGYQDVPNMKKDTDLDPLRQREDFQKLVAELEGKGK